MSEEVEPLYSCVQRVLFKRGSTEESERELRVTVECRAALTQVSPRTLRVRLTDDEDPFFLYSLTLAQEDYHKVKASQGLLVDFLGFPAQVVRLLEECRRGTTFLLFLHQDPVPYTQLKIVETNKFKHLCHLVLELEPGSDTDIKKLMLDKIAALKEEDTKKEASITRLESQLASTQELLNEARQQLSASENKRSQETAALKVELTSELARERENLERNHLDFRLRAEKDKTDLEQKLLKIIEEKESQISELKLECQLVSEKKKAVEKHLGEHVRAIEAFERELSSLKKENSSLRKQSAKIDADYHEKEKFVNSLKTKLAVTEQELKDQHVLNERQQEFLFSANEDKSKLECALGEKEKALEMREATLKRLSEELTKANEIIGRLQKDLAIANNKLKVRTGIALEQEKVVESHLKRLTDLEKELSERNLQLASLKESENKLSTSYTETKELLASQEKKLKERDKVIEWLNKKLNEQSKPFLSMSANSSTSGIPSAASSTPYSMDNRHENASTLAPSSRSNITQLDRMAPLAEEEENVEPPDAPPLDSSSKPKFGSSKKPSLKSKPIGFKRLTPVQPTSVPSSYFLN